MMKHECLNEERLRCLEISESAFRSDIKSLVAKVDTLINWIQIFIIMFGTGLISAFGYLLVKWVEGK